MVDFFRRNKIVPLRADRDENPETDPLLLRLGNSARAIPYYAVFRGDLQHGDHFGGVFLTPNLMIDRLEQALAGSPRPILGETPPAGGEPPPEPAAMAPPAPDGQ